MPQKMKTRVRPMKTMKILNASLRFDRETKQIRALVKRMKVQPDRQVKTPGSSPGSRLARIFRGDGVVLGMVNRRKRLALVLAKGLRVYERQAQVCFRGFDSGKGGGGDFSIEK